jgi:hypothetical protein
MVVDLIEVIGAAPKDEDVVAGPIGFVIFIGLVIAVALLGWSLNKHLKKAHRAEEAGVYGGPSAHDSAHDSADGGGAGDGTGD